MKVSGSVTKGTGNLNHNRRQLAYVKDNIDRSRTPNNVVLVDRDIQELYAEIFGLAVNEYNAKQKRADRKIKNYYKKIQHDKKTKTFQELVVQIGSRDAQISPEKAIQVYTDFLEEFKKNNPQMAILGAYVHMDEATPHLHLDYVPYAEYSKGMSRRVSNDRAMAQMGYKNWNEWREKQDQLLSMCMQKQELEREIVGDISRHKTIAEYKTLMRAMDKQIEQVSKEARITALRYGQNIATQEKIPEQNELLKAKNATLEQYTIELEAEIMEMRKKRYIEENRALEARNRELERRNEELERENQEKNLLKKFIEKLHLGKLYEKFKEYLTKDEEGNSDWNKQLTTEVQEILQKNFGKEIEEREIAGYMYEAEEEALEKYLDRDNELTI